MGPNAYDINYAQTSRRAPRATMGTQARFRASRYAYISAGHNSDLLCTASPGPIYYVPAANVTARSAPAYSWGPAPHVSYASKPTDRKSSAAFSTSGSDEVGPAMYAPKHAAVLPAAPRAVFPQQPRFTDKPLAYVQCSAGTCGCVL